MGKLENISQHKPSGRTLLAVVGVLAFALVAALVLLIWQAEEARYGSPPPLWQLSFLVYALLGLLTAVLLSGILQSVAAVNGEYAGLTLQLGGPAALFTVVLVVGIHSHRAREAEEFSASLIFHEGPSRGNILEKDGTVSLHLVEGVREVEVRNGRAVITNIPRRFDGDTVTMKTLIVGYRPVPVHEVTLMSDHLVYVELASASVAKLSVPREVSLEDGDLGALLRRAVAEGAHVYIVESLAER